MRQVHLKSMWMGIAITAFLLGPRPAAARSVVAGLGLGLPTLSAPRWQTEAGPLPPPPVKIPESAPSPAPGTRAAPEAAAPASAPGYELVGETAASPPDLPDPTKVTRPPEPGQARFRPPWDPGTMAVQLLMEGGATLVSVLLGLGTAMVLGSGSWDSLAYVILGSAIASVILHPLAAYLGGKWMRGRGSVLGTILGFLAGVGGSILISGLGSTLGEPATTLFALLATAVFYAGPIVGYHVSAVRVVQASFVGLERSGARERLLALQATRTPHPAARRPRTFPLIALRY